MSHRNLLKGMLIVLATSLLGGLVWADGNTLAASAKTQTLSFENTRTLVAGLDGTDVCATIVNRSESTGLIEITLTDDVAATTTSQIKKSKSSALCGMDTDSVSVECLGPKKCAFTWSVDEF